MIPAFHVGTRAGGIGQRVGAPVWTFSLLSMIQLKSCVEWACSRSGVKTT
ncbi:hypothetical protein KMAL_25720 [Novacetimonas maltaceti]|uniref:Uncharacterized protein n=1 Tax=Novacetimonas maltaceti TaxID=1203393 RepID=A0A2S3VYY5_9PROT|nr:hypothetical protein KMAL_25720 [Novacetimonas maltaceti]